MASDNDRFFRDLEYLQPGFDPDALWMPDLRKILVTHDIPFPQNASKNELLETFGTKLVPRRKEILERQAKAVRDAVQLSPTKHSKRSAASQIPSNMKMPLNFQHRSHADTARRPMPSNNVGDGRREPGQLKGLESMEPPHKNMQVPQPRQRGDGEDTLKELQEVMKRQHELQAKILSKLNKLSLGPSNAGPPPQPRVTSQTQSAIRFQGDTRTTDPSSLPPPRPPRHALPPQFMARPPQGAWSPGQQQPPPPPPPPASSRAPSELVREMFELDDNGNWRLKRRER